MEEINNNNNKDNSSKFITRFYIVLSIIAVIVMIIAAYITYGYQAKEIVISFDNVVQKIKDKNTTTSNKMTIGADLSNVPSDKVIEDILNNVMPDICDDCDEDPLDCLKEYEINKILIQDKQYQNYLVIELITGKHEKKIFRVVIDLSNNNAVVNVEGEIDKKRCRDVVEEDSVEDDEIFLDKGDDPKSSHYIKVTPKE